MTPLAQNAGLTEIGQADLRRFVVQTALLKLIDPVRGAPTRTALDENPDVDISGGQQLKQKFLDSFALLCATSGSGKETASAVCLEQHDPTRTVLRVARNRGLTPQVLADLERVLQVLQVVAQRRTTSAQAEPEILRLVVELDRDRILSLANRVATCGLQDFLQETHSKLLAGKVSSNTWENSGLKVWLDICPFAGAVPNTWSSATMTLLIDWASQTRWVYAERLQKILGLDHAQKPHWLDTLYKIARYRAAIKSMIKFAAKQPEAFEDIEIHDIKAPISRPFSLLKEKAPFSALLRNLMIKEDSGMILEKLQQHLGKQDVEAEMRKACRVDLTLHAEMQLVVFYEGNPALVPRIPFIGTSKKACFLCYEYLLQHPLRLQVSACHQKVYPTWMPPPYYPTSGGAKSVPFRKLAQNIEKLAKGDLKTALTTPRRPKNQDSTAGPSLTITATTPTGLSSRRAASEYLG